MAVAEHRVSSTGLGLAVRQYGGHDAGGHDAGAAQEHRPHIVLVHGFPDSQDIWVPGAERLAAAGTHVVTYDVRGAGGSDVPERTAGYRLELLVDDLVAVLDSTVPAGERVHLVGHDWGSVQLWEAVLSEADHPGLRGRIASFTSVSGPALDHVGHLLRHPAGRRLRLLRQLGRSWYVLAFHVPVLPELVWRTAYRPLGALAARKEPGADEGWGPEVGRDGAHGVNLYRANMLQRGRRAAAGRGRRTAAGRGRRTALRRTHVPVVVVAPLRDPFLTSLVVEDLDRLCCDVRVVRPDTGHWLPRTAPDVLADLVLEQVRAHP
jgi:pimeloyl-ACP methyl ester carboxylesterase